MNNNNNNNVGRLRIRHGSLPGMPHDNLRIVPEERDHVRRVNRANLPRHRASTDHTEERIRAIIHQVNPVPAVPFWGVHVVPISTEAQLRVADAYVIKGLAEFTATFNYFHEIANTCLDPVHVIRDFALKIFAEPLLGQLTICKNGGLSPGYDDLKLTRLYEAIIAALSQRLMNQEGPSVEDRLYNYFSSYRFKKHSDNRPLLEDKYKNAFKNFLNLN